MKHGIAIFFWVSGSILLAVGKPTFSGTWLLDAASSSGDVPSYSSLSVSQDSKWFRLAQLSADGRKQSTVESECRLDGKFHPVSSEQGGSVRCNWDGSTLVVEKHWNDAKNKSMTKVALTPDGKLIQDVTTQIDQVTNSAHLVWNRKQ